MVNASYFVADAADEAALLAHLRHPAEVDLLPWPVVDRTRPALTAADLDEHDAVVVHLRALGPVALVAGPGSELDPDPLPSVGIFARHRSAPVPVADGDPRGLVDTNRSPVLLWERRVVGAGCRLSTVGSQADSPDVVGDDYVRWVRRVQSWVRRTGTPVWGLRQHEVRPDLDVRFSFVNTVVALPGALARLEAGERLRDR